MIRIQGTGDTMTEQQREDDLLAGLLDTPEAPTPLDATPAHIELTRRDERVLLDAANHAGTATLAPQKPAPVAAGSFAGEVTEFIRRYPIPSLLAGAAVAYLLTRRRH
jgi:hypothetical protein